MGPSDASSIAQAATRGIVRRRSTRRLRDAARAALVAGLLAGLAACSPPDDWREVHAPGGEYRVQLPAKPAAMTRQIHLQDQAVAMTMQGARVGENAFTVAVAPLSAAMSAERMLIAMREQMLRNIGAPPATPVVEVNVPIVRTDGSNVGSQPAQEIVAQGTGQHAAMRMHGRFMRWRDEALQIVAIGPDLDREQVEHFLASLRLVAQ
jgi:hypothetical protein